MPGPLQRLFVRAAAALTLVLTVAACGGVGAGTTPSPAPTVRPTPTPVVATVTSPQDAATLVIASDAMFTGAMEHDPELIGGSKWWTAKPLPGGGYEIVMTVGWGDCMAGCIERHTWTFNVSPDGTIEKVAEEGDPVPADLPA